MDLSCFLYPQDYNVGDKVVDLSAPIPKETYIVEKVKGHDPVLALLSTSNYYPADYEAYVLYDGVTTRLALGTNQNSINI